MEYFPILIYIKVFNRHSTNYIKFQTKSVMHQEVFRYSVMKSWNKEVLKKQQHTIDNLSHHILRDQHIDGLADPGI